MSPLVPLVGLLAAVFVCLAVRELAMTGATGEATSSRDSGDQTPAAAVSLGLPERIRRAGRSKDLSPRSLLLLKAAAALLAVSFAAIVSPLMPSKIAPVVVPLSLLAGFFFPDLLLERAGRRRHRTMIAALPDALDLLAVSVATGKSLGAGLLELLEAGRGPLSRALAETGEDMAWGASQSDALEGLRQRMGGKEIAALCATLERSRKLGSPLADQLRGQSTGLRRDQKRAIEEQAARAAPKMQLVIALVLVPSVLLMIAASLVANSDVLLGGL
jgi:tight adherence protein C